MLFAAAVCLAGTGVCATTSAALAQDVRADRLAPGAAEAQRRVLFAHMMANPSDLDAAFEYAALSAQAGDLEGAISTLERMLIFAPGLPRLQLELGVLYYRLSADEAAASYLEAAISGPDVPREVRERVAPFLEAIDRRRQPAGFSGGILFGARYQSNANAAPGSRLVNLNGFDFILAEDATSRPDVNGFAAGSFRYSLDLERQGDRLDATLQTYGALYADRSELDIGLVEATVGPTFNLQRFGIDDATLSLYGIGGGVVLASDPYLYTYGAGLAVFRQVDATRFGLRAEYRRDEFRNSSLRPTAANRTGNRVRLQANAERRLSQRFALFGQVTVERRTTARDYLNVWEYGATVGGTLLLDSPVPALEQPWSLSLSLGYLSGVHDAPDPVVSRTMAQRDREGSINASLAVPLASNWSLQASAGYRRVWSNYDMRNMDNVSTSLGLMRTF